MIRGGLLLTAGQIISFGCSFARNIILARVLTKADFGIAAMFGLTISLLEFSGKMSFSKLLIQSPSGRKVEFKNTIHSFQLWTNISSCVLIAALAVPIATLFNTQDKTWAFALLATIPFLRAFENLDYQARQRDFIYFPVILYEVVPQVIITVAAWPLALWINDFTVILWLLIAKSLISLATSHITAQNPIGYAWNKKHIKDIVKFSWPLFLNGFLMFGVQQADQLVIGSRMSLENLAVYYLAYSLTSIPWFIFAQVASSLILPVLSNIQNDRVIFQKTCRSCIEFSAIFSILLLMPIVIAGEVIIPFLYSSKYENIATTVALLGTATAFRFMRFTSATISMAKGDTLNQFYTNIVRISSLPLSLLAVYYFSSLEAVAACAILGELLAYLFSVYRLKKHQGIPYKIHLSPFLYFVIFSILGMSAIYIQHGNDSLSLPWLNLAGMILSSSCIAIILFRTSTNALTRSLLSLLRTRATTE